MATTATGTMKPPRPLALAVANTVFHQVKPDSVPTTPFTGAFKAMTECAIAQSPFRVIPEDTTDRKVSHDAFVTVAGDIEFRRAGLVGFTEAVIDGNLEVLTDAFNAVHRQQIRAETLQTLYSWMPVIIPQIPDVIHAKLMTNPARVVRSVLMEAAELGYALIHRRFREFYRHLVKVGLIGTIKWTGPDVCESTYYRWVVDQRQVSSGQRVEDVLGASERRVLKHENGPDEIITTTQRGKLITDEQHMRRDLIREERKEILYEAKPHDYPANDVPMPQGVRNLLPKAPHFLRPHLKGVTGWLLKESVSHKTIHSSDWTEKNTRTEESEPVVKIDRVWDPVLSLGGFALAGWNQADLDRERAATVIAPPPPPPAPPPDAQANPFPQPQPARSVAAGAVPQSSDPDLIALFIILPLLLLAGLGVVIWLVNRDSPLEALAKRAKEAGLTATIERDGKKFSITLPPIYFDSVRELKESVQREMAGRMSDIKQIEILAADGERINRVVVHYSDNTGQSKTLVRDDAEIEFTSLWRAYTPKGREQATTEWAKRLTESLKTRGSGKASVTSGTATPRVEQTKPTEPAAKPAPPPEPELPPLQELVMQARRAGLKAEIDSIGHSFRLTLPPQYFDSLPYVMDEVKKETTYTPPIPLTIRELELVSATGRRMLWVNIRFTTNNFHGEYEKMIFDSNINMNAKGESAAQEQAMQTWAKKLAARLRRDADAKK